MKRIRRALFLLLACALPLSACGAAIPKTEPAPTSAETALDGTEKTPDGTEPETKEEGRPSPAITPPVTRADVEAIPIANASMTEDELRAICVRYMTLEKSVEWTHSTDR